MSIEEIGGEEYYRITDTEDIEDGQRVVVNIRGKEIAIFNSDGDFHAVANFCPHQYGPLCEGMLSGTLETNSDLELVYEHENKIISCPWHGWEFDVESGAHLGQTKKRVPTYDVKTKDGVIYLQV